MSKWHKIWNHYLTLICTSIYLNNMYEAEKWILKKKKDTEREEGLLKTILEVVPFEIGWSVAIGIESSTCGSSKWSRVQCATIGCSPKATSSTPAHQPGRRRIQEITALRNFRFFLRRQLRYRRLRRILSPRRILRTTQSCSYSVACWVTKWNVNGGGIAARQLSPVVTSSKPMTMS